MIKILLVDDQVEALLSLTRALKANEPSFTIEAVATAERALIYLSKQEVKVAVIDLSLDPKRGVESGFDLLHSICLLDAPPKIIVLTGNSSVENGVRALGLGAAHFLEKPPELAHLAALIRDCAAQADLLNAFNDNSKGVGSVLLQQDLVGISPQVEALKEELLFAASTNQSILLVGETGTGKTHCASLIHSLSSRSRNKFVYYSPAFNSSDLVNKDLYGHLKGSFTGATESRAGMLRESDAGTLFLDEVDELPQETQVSLLRAIQNKSFRVLGSNKEEKSNFRLITATNRRQDELLSSGKLREDFYHRIAHKIIRLPTLRERREDIRNLSTTFLQALTKREEVRVYSIEPEVFLLLEKYVWPGNVRELQAVIEGAAYLAQFKGRSEILAKDLKFEASNYLALNTSTEAKGFHEQVENFKLKLVKEALDQSEGNQVQAAKQLGLDRSSLRRILARE